MKTTSSTLPRHRSLAQRLLPAAAVATCLLWGAGHADAGGGHAPSDRASGSDPTVGTLPMTGGGGDPLDQTIELRGRTEDIRAAILQADGNGFVDVIPLGGGQALMRFYGDVRVELDLSRLAQVDLSIWAGFDGGGMAYAVGSPDGLGRTSGLDAGFSLGLDPIGFANVGLLDEPLSIHGFHRTGQRTRTTLLRGASAGSLLLFQDV